MNIQTTDPADEPIPYEIVGEGEPVKGMLLHCGGQLPNRAQLKATTTPRGTSTGFIVGRWVLIHELELPFGDKTISLNYA